MSKLIEKIIATGTIPAYAPSWAKMDNIQWIQKLDNIISNPNKYQDSVLKRTLLEAVQKEIKKGERKNGKLKTNEIVNQNTEEIIITRFPQIDQEWRFCHDLNGHCEIENDCRDCPYGIDHTYE